MIVSAASVEKLARALVGTWLRGKYRVERLLGYGGAACVFSATHRNGHRVAIKLLHPTVATDEQTRARFLREGYLANQVAHRSAVRVLDDDVLPDGSVFLVMELLEGETLDDLAEKSKGKLPLKLACRAAYQLLDVLAAAHDKGIVHRDIKPQNLFWTTDGVLKVLDFGLARIGQPGSTKLTQTGEVFGTPAFMSPEQAVGEMDDVGPASDQWSAAATFFTLATGSFVHDARTPTEMIVLNATRPARSIREVDPTIPVRIGNVIDRALRLRKEERWPHVSDLQRALKLAYEGELGGSLAMPTLAPVTASSFPGPASGKPAPRGVAIAVGTALAVLLAGVGVAQWVSRSPTSPGTAADGAAPELATPATSHSSAGDGRGEVEAPIPAATGAPAAAPSAADAGEARAPARSGPAPASARPASSAAARSSSAPAASPGGARPRKPDPWSTQ